MWEEVQFRLRCCSVQSEDLSEGSVGLRRPSVSNADTELSEQDGAAPWNDGSSRPLILSPRSADAEMERGRDTRNFKALDALRGFAALAVSYLHLSFSVPPVCNYPLHLSVDFFLILSGFVLAQSYPFAARESTPWSFMRRRFARLWPLQAYSAFVTYIVCVYVVRAVPDTAETVMSLFAELLLLNGLGLPLPQDVLNSPSWTVSCEFLINLPYAFLAKRAPAVVWLVFCIAGQVFLFHHTGSLATTGGLDGLVRCASGFCLGASCFPMYMGLEEWGRTRLRMGTWAFTALEAVLLTLAWCLLAERNHYASKHDFLAPWIFAAVVMCFACEGGLLSKMLCHMRYLGLISYSIYLNHRAVLVLLFGGQPAGGGITSQFQALPIFWALLLPYAFITYRIVELPSLKVLSGSARTPGLFEGRWLDDDSDWGVISGDKFVSMDGLVGSLAISGPKIVMNLGGVVHIGELWKDGKLHWADGYVWVRAPSD